MLLISRGKRRPKDKYYKRVYPLNEELRVVGFRKWQSDRVVKEFGKTEEGARLKAKIDKLIEIAGASKNEKPRGQKSGFQGTQVQITEARLRYTEKLIVYLLQKKGVYRSTITQFENEAKEFRKILGR